MSYEHKIQLLMTDANGVHIPRLFVENFEVEKWDLDPADMHHLADPYGMTYWDAWDDVLRIARYTDSEGHTWMLHQDGDLWAVRTDMTEDEWTEAFGH